MLRLDLEQRTILLTVLKKYFGSVAELGTFLLDYLGQTLEEFVNDNLENSRSAVVDRAERKGWILDLIKALRAVVPPGLQAELDTMGTIEEIAEARANEGEIAPEFLPALCDRKDEQERFEQAFDDSEERVPGAPKFYCLLGDFRARHDLFVARLREGVLATRTRSLGGTARGAPDTVRVAEVNWPTQWPSRHGLKPLISSLFRQLSSTVAVRQPDRSGLAALVAGLRESVVVVTHPMPLDRWMPETTKRLGDYLALWRDAAGLMRQINGDRKPATRKEVIVLFTVSWPRIVDQVVRERVETAVAEIKTSASRSRTLPLFTPIRFSTVSEPIIEEWANAFSDKLLAVRTKKYCRNLFQTAPERQLGEVIDQFYEALTE